MNPINVKFGVEQHTTRSLPHDKFSLMTKQARHYELIQVRFGTKEHAISSFSHGKLPLIGERGAWEPP